MVALLAFAAPAAFAARAPEKVVLVSVDGLDRASLATTPGLPSLEAIGGRGLRDDGARAPAPLAFVATVTLLTGRSPESTGVLDEATRGLDGRGPTLATALRDRGFSGLALPADPLAHAKSGLARGFERWLALSPALAESARVDSATAWLRRPGRRFAWLALSLGPPAEAWRRADGIGPSEPGALGSRLRELDAALARLARGIAAAGLEPVTLVAVAGTGGSAAARRPGVEEPCAVPLVLAGPGVASPAPVMDRHPPRRTLADVAPTIASLARGGTAGFDGRSLVGPPGGASGVAPEVPCAGDPRGLEPGESGSGDSSCLDAWRLAAEGLRTAPDSVALERWSEAVERCPGSPRVALEFAVALTRAGREVDAARRYQSLIGGHPDYPEAAIAYAEHLLRFGRHELVAGSLVAIPPDAPLAGLAAWRAALATASRLELVTALDEVERAAALVVPTPEALATRASLERLRAARVRSDLEPRSLEARLDYGRALGQFGLFEEAYRELHAARGIDPTSAEADYWMGTLLIEQGRARHAVPAFERGLARDSTHRPSRLALADGLLRLERRSEARRQLERALVQDPADPRAQYNLACLLALDHEPDAALEALERAVRYGYADWERVRTDPDLSSIRDDPRFARLLGGATR